MKRNVQQLLISLGLLLFCAQVLAFPFLNCCEMDQQLPMHGEFMHGQEVSAHEQGVSDDGKGVANHSMHFNSMQPGLMRSGSIQFGSTDSDSMHWVIAAQMQNTTHDISSVTPVSMAEEHNFQCDYCLAITSVPTIASASIELEPSVIIVTINAKSFLLSSHIENLFRPPIFA